MAEDRSINTCSVAEIIMGNNNFGSVLCGKHSAYTHIFSAGVRVNVCVVVVIVVPTLFARSMDIYLLPVLYIVCYAVYLFPKCLHSVSFTVHAT